jgi:hypothetical protein
MLQLALEKKENEYKDQRVKELDEVEKLRQGLQKEKQDKIDKKIKERQRAALVIQENEVNKSKKLE